jgi:hypothetical protein
MDDRRAQYLLICEDICHAAFLADIQVELTTCDGRRLRGIPTLPGSGVGKRRSRSAEIVIDLDEQRVALEAIVRVSVAAPMDAAR